MFKLGNIHKFNQHADLGKVLLETDGKGLILSDNSDKVWGIRSEDSINVDNIYEWEGHNLAGFALMEVRDFFKKFGFWGPLQNELAPPWLAYPKMDSRDMFWRMGIGETYITEFSLYYDSLSERDKDIYQLMYPQPGNWDSFYE